MFCQLKVLTLVKCINYNMNLQIWIFITFITYVFNDITNFIKICYRNIEFSVKIKIYINNWILTRSNLDNIGAEILTFCKKLRVLSYIIFTGFATAKTEVLAFKVVCIPALLREIICCSIAS